MNVEQIELADRDHCSASIALVDVVALIDAEFKRQRRMEEDEDDEVDEKLAAELRQETLVLVRCVDVYKQPVERLRN